MKHTAEIYAKSFLRAVEAEGPRPAILRNFLNVVRKNAGLQKLPEILKKIELSFLREKGFAKVEVITARDLASELEPDLKKHFGRNAIILFSVRPEIIGGVIFKINEETVIDASVRRRLKQLFVTS